MNSLSSQSSNRKKGFSLVELLTVISIIALMATLSGPAINALTGAGTVNKAIFDFSGTLQSARAYAMANHTYVRVAIAQDAGSSRLVILSLYSADGTLAVGAANPVASDMANSMLWPMMSKPLILENLGIFNGINAVVPATANDALPSDSSTTLSPPFSRAIAGNLISFQWVIQFTPSGEAAVLQSLADAPVPVRYIKIAVDRPFPGNPSSPMSGQSSSPQKQFILRLSGVNGSVSILRKGAGI